MAHFDIKDACREAQEISEKHGTREGLAFLIGEKFCRKYYDFKKIQNKLKFLYPDEFPEGTSPFDLGDDSLKLSYAVTLNDNYRELLENFEYLNKSLAVFIREIKKSFDVNDILDYLNSYPRLLFKQELAVPEEPGMESETSISVADAISEAEDILLIEQVKKLFW